MSGQSLNQDGAQRDKTLLEVTMKARKPFIFTIQTGVCLAIAAALKQSNSLCRWASHCLLQRLKKLNSAKWVSLDSRKKQK
jgi:hypothetical protein